MGSIITLQNEIQAIIEGMDNIQYLRAKESEANIALNDLQVSDCLAIHFDRTTVAAGIHNQNHIIKIIPTEILFVYKNTELDDKQTDIDILIDQAEDKADEFFDRLIQSAVINDLGEFEDYELNRLEADKRFDAILSGVLFTWDTPVSRKTYYCGT